MAYPTGLEKTRAGTLSAHPGYVCRLGENGRGESNGKATEMSADPHAVVVVTMSYSTQVTSWLKVGR